MLTITTPGDVDRLFREGTRAGRETVVVLCVPTSESRDPHEGRVIFIAGKKLGGAVLRNRCKRVLRERCRSLGGPWEGFDVALIARSTTASAAPEVLDRDISAALRKLKVV